VTDERQVGLFEAAFPFHFLVDAERCIVRVGPSLAKAFPRLRTGDPLQAQFEIMRPPRAFERWDRHLERPRTIWVLRDPESGLRLRGQMLTTDDGCAYFAGSPWLEDLDALDRSNLRLSDFAVHDASIDYVALMQGLHTSLQDARELADRLAEANRGAQEANAAKSQFLAIMSHEIRTPLNGVLGLVDLLLDGELPVEVREALTVVHSSSKMLQVLLSDILDFSKIEAGRLELEELEVDPRALVFETRKLFAEMASKRGLNLEVAVDPRLPGRVWADSTRLRQLLSNLVNNAIKFTELGDVVIVARLEGGLAGHSWSLEVRDTGLGMDQETQARLFEPFMQADASTTRRFGGTGLGLSICRRLVELMGGSLSVHSTPGVGSRFTAKLPLKATERIQNEALRLYLPEEWRGGLAELNATLGIEVVRMDEAEVRWKESGGEAWLEDDLGRCARLPASPAGVSLGPWVRCLGPWLGDARVFPGERATVVEGARTETVQAPIPAPRSNGSRPCVVVADDTPTNRLVARKMLDRLGLEACLCETGSDVLQILDPDVHRLVLMDFQMPGLDGFEATRRLRERFGDACPVILGFTANGLAEEHQRALDAGMAGIVSKPVELQALRIALEPWLPEIQPEGGRGGRPERRVDEPQDPGSRG
jgi:signal transduction histidine kinase/ActR/RegA family two-component response regulator